MEAVPTRENGQGSAVPPAVAGSREAAAIPASARPKRAPGLYTVIAFKLGKALFLLALALGIFSLLGEDVNAQFGRFLRYLRQDPEHEFWTQLGRVLEKLTPENIRFIASGTMLYAVLLFVESLGLMRRMWWAIWLAIGETAFFIPVEILDLMRHFRVGMLALLVVNVLIVWYLARNRQRLFRHH